MQPLPTTNERPFVFLGLRLFFREKVWCRKKDLESLSARRLSLNWWLITGKTGWNSSMTFFFFFVISGQPKLQADNWESQCPGEQPAAVKITTRQRKKKPRQEIWEDGNEEWDLKGQPGKKKKVGGAWPNAGKDDVKLSSTVWSRPQTQACFRFSTLLKTGTCDIQPPRNGFHIYFHNL